MDKLSIGVLLGATVTGVGWIVTHFLSSRRERIARQEMAAREFLEKQIQELYGPLLGLAQHARIVSEVAKKKLPIDEKGKIDYPRFTENDGQIWRFFIENYFGPLNTSIRDLVRTKMHLLDEVVLPESFAAFFYHEAQSDALYALWQEKGIDSWGIKGHEWPEQFEVDIESTLRRLRKRHAQLVPRLARVDAH